MAGLPGVADVRYDREWLGRLASGLDAVRGAGLALALLMAVAAAITVAAVVRLGLHARRDEIEIMKLVGSPMTFIRGPFVAEGLLQGGIGRGAGAGAPVAGFCGRDGLVGRPAGRAAGRLVVAFLPLRLAAAPGGRGMVVGAAGGFAASRHAG